MNVHARPRRLRISCAIAAAAILTVFGAVALLLPAGADGSAFTVGDQIAMAGLGVVLAGVVLLFARPAVEADNRGVRVRNMFGAYDLPWQVIVAVRFPDRSPWAFLELDDDETVALMAVQANDGERAVAVVRRLRDLLEDSRRR